MSKFLNLKFKIVFLVVIVGILIDQLSKYWARNYLSDKSIFLFESDLGFSLTSNSGSAFSLFQSSTFALTLFATIVSIGVAIGIYKSNSKLAVLSLSLIFAGAIGNLLDRYFQPPYSGRGHVTDFIKIYSWPTFNIADSLVCVGAGLLILSTIKNSDDSK